MLVICNEKLRELYGNLTLTSAFAKADDVLTTAAKGIAELITVAGHVNVDLKDVRAVMKDGGKALMGLGVAGRRTSGLRGYSGCVIISITR